MTAFYFGRRSGTALALVFAASTLPTLALAQAQTPTAPTSSLDEIVVTAQRRSENIQQVPLAVTSLSQKGLEKAQVTDTLDIARLVPNMVASNNVGLGSANVYYIRGLGQTQSFPTFEPQVGTYVDDIYIGRQNANNLSLFGVQQVQVLRGPQGTLFGRNSTGGAIVVTLQKPSDAFGGDAEVSYGANQRFSARASVDLPINSQIATRTSVFGISDEGYVNDLTTSQKLNGTQSLGVREAVRVRPTNYSNVEWNGSIDYSDTKSASVLNQPGSGGINGNDRITYSGFSTDGGALVGLLTGDKSHLGQGVEVKSWGAASNFKINFAAGDLELITGFRGLDQANGVDFPDSAFGPAKPYDQFAVGQFALAQTLSSAQYSQEVKWSGKVGDRLTYTTGVFYLYETNRNSFGAVANLGPLFGLNYLPFPLGDEFTQNDTNSTAVYAQGDYKFTDKLTVTLGGRFTHEIKTLSAAPNAPGAGFTTAQIQAVGYLTRLKADEFTPRIAVQYQWDPNLMLFASATRGFQGGGWNGLAFTAQTFNNFNPETVWSYETGFRAQTPDHHLRVNATLFYEDVQNYQLLSDLTTAASFVTTNASNFDAYGAEVDVDWRPIDDLTLSAQLGLMNATYYGASKTVLAQQAACRAAPGPANSNCASGIVDPSGALATPSNTPPATVSAGATYDFHANTFTLSPNIGLQYVARQNVGTEGSPNGIDPARTVLDLGMTLHPNGAPWTLTAECRNCTMQDWGTAYLFGYKYYNNPGVWDVKVRYKF
jgi:iron complex outermembrane receptor protein